MKLAVVGSRKWAMPHIITKTLDDVYPDEIVTGGAEGADKFAEAWALLHHVPCKVFKPDWNKYGKKAGALRNREIVDYCDFLVAFWDGRSRGTKISIEMAGKANKLLRVYQE